MKSNIPSSRQTVFSAGRINIKRCDNTSLRGKCMLTAYRLPQTLSDRKIHTCCCCVIMQSSAFKQKAVTPSRAALCPSKSSLLVLTEMSASYQRRVISRGLHTWLHAVRHLFFSPIMNMDIFPTNGVDLFYALTPRRV